MSQRANILKEISIKIAALLLLSFFSCTKICSEPVVSGQIEPEQTAQVSFTASIEQTKVAFSETSSKLKADWELNDKVFGWWQSSTASGTISLSVSSIDGNGLASLTPDSGSTVPAEGAAVYMTYSPNNTVADLSKNHRIAVNFSSQASTLAGRKANSYMCATATVSGGEARLHFTQQTAVLEILQSKIHLPATAGAITSVEISGSELGGSGMICLNESKWTLVPGKEGSITISSPSAGNIFVNVPPTASPTTLTIVAKDSNSKSYKAEVASAKTIVAGKCYTLPDITLNEYSPTTKSISILAIGNSFSVDAMQYLYPMLQQAGYEQIVLGNLYIGGCTLQTHATNLTSDSASYTYYKNTANNWTTTNSQKASSALLERNWDYISLQQASGSSGIPTTYDSYLATVINKVRELCPTAQLMWHMTWAYQSDATHSEFPKYDSNQMTMYNAIVSAVQTKVLPTNEFAFVIPCGTAVQNLRSSYIGDNVTRDGYHMSYKDGRFVTAMMWTKQITGCDLADITYKPTNYSYPESEVKAIKDAVAKAYVDPYTPSESAVQEASSINRASADEIMRSHGKEPGNYTQIALGIETYAYYNSTTSWNLNSKSNSSATNLNQFAATKRLKKSELPNGSCIVLLSGYQYRPEGWQTEGAVNSSTRPANTTAEFTEIDSSWWGDFNFRAFNIAAEGNPALTEQQMSELATGVFRIYVPKQLQNFVKETF